ncbi:SelT/SelW/SelH family protein [Streptomyces sp. NPDC051445]|uniref:SelT/SelW/SelH family protein n=1 Tax=Streptomyces sp. NPDC051445 TaxID=3365653 RepID=UPI0037BE1ED5
MSDLNDLSDDSGDLDEASGANGADEPGGPDRRVEIEYCTQCRWLPRAAWLAQELLTTFEGELTELALKPGKGGVFVVRVNDEVVWDRREQGFPEPTAVKKLVRDRVAPGRSLGHSDR